VQKQLVELLLEVMKRDLYDLYGKLELLSADPDFVSVKNPYFVINPFGVMCSIWGTEIPWQVVREQRIEERIIFLLGIIGNVDHGHFLPIVFDHLIRMKETLKLFNDEVNHTHISKCDSLYHARGVNRYHFDLLTQLDKVIDVLQGKKS